MKDDVLTPSSHGLSAIGCADVDPCAALKGRCFEFDDHFWILEMQLGWDDALKAACNTFSIAPQLGEAILACHDALNNGNF